ncbi:heparin lyase I family protein [Rufibacter sp. DG15C]|uniref:heparin lyase I family protein n=1 Tax=Rufibacter sp. DG15C TaxID=1379909 RepID=UPI0008303454|nr:heparin lyase I family protein [Rufibacter sp. DG15C]
MGKFILLLYFMLLSCTVAAQTSIVPFGSTWKYLDNGTNQGTAWRTSPFSETGWKTGDGKFGYGISDAKTVISYGSSAKKKYITTYFRKTITITNLTAYISFSGKVKRDDGVVVYVNGTEVYRNNMPTGTISYTTLASEAKDNGGTAQTFSLSSNRFVEGTNLVAVEVHQQKVSTPDMAFDLELTGQLPPADVTPPTVSSISRQNPATAIVASGNVTYRATFSEPVTGVGIDDFTLFSTGSATGQVTDLVAVSAFIYDVTVLPSGEGDLRLDLKNTGTGITDASGNAITTGYTAGQSYTLQLPPPPDQTPPSALSINRQLPLSDSTHATTISFRATFSEAVTGVDGPDFSLATLGSATGEIGSIQSVSTSIYDVVVTNVSGQGELRLDLNPSNTGILDAAGNALVDGFSSGQSYYVSPPPPDVTSPTVVSINRQSPATSTIPPGNATFRATLSEPVTGVSLEDFQLIATDSASGEVTGVNAISATAYDVSLTAAGSGTLRLDVKDADTNIQDAAGNTLKEGFPGGQTYTVQPVISPPEPQYPDLFSFGSSWKYLDNGTDQGTAWRAVDFDESTWKTGNGKFGYGIPDAATVLQYGPSTTSKYITTYFRKSISLSEPADYGTFSFNIKMDDGAVLYVNGVEKYRYNMPTGNIGYRTLASVSSSGDGSKTLTFFIHNSAFVKGKNVIAVEIHQQAANSNDLAFDLQIGSSHKSPVVLYYEGFESGTGFAGLHMQTSTAYGFTVESDTVYSGKKAGRWELRAGDPPAADGTRAEVLFSDEVAQEETWHSFAGYFPSANYLLDSDDEAFNQWHQGGEFGSPLLTLRTQDGRFEVRRRSADGTVLNIHVLGPIIYDQWISVVIHIKQHLTDGFMQVWINGDLRLDIKGLTTMYNGPFGKYKMGLYKSDWNNKGVTQSKKRVWFVDEVKIGNAANTYESMKPATNLPVPGGQATSTQVLLMEEPPFDALKIYPNPVKRGSLVTVQASDNSINEIMVSDMSGHIVYRSAFMGTTALETKNLASGLYVVSSIGKRSTAKQKFIITN